MKAQGCGTLQRRGESADAAELPFSFADIAARYDILNRLMSLGCDRRWREVAARAAALPPGGRALDVGAGTGDVTLALQRRRPEATVIGLDPSAAMMHAGQGKPGAAKAGWVQGNGLRLPFPDRYFDAVVSSFLLRNIADSAGALAEQLRVARLGGRVVCLEMTWPRRPIFRQVYQLYFVKLLPPLMGLLSGQPAAYRYLPRSVEQFMSPEKLKAEMEQVGLQNVHCRTMMLGTVALHVGERADE